MRPNLLTVPPDRREVTTMAASTDGTASEIGRDLLLGVLRGS